MIKVISDNTKQLFYFELNGREVCGVARYIDDEPLEFRLNWESAGLGNTNITMLFFNGSVIRNAIESVHAYYKQNRYI